MTQLQTLQQFEDDMNWITEQYEELKLRFPEQFVAVHHHEVVDHDAEMRALMARLRQQYGVGATSIAVEFIRALKDELIL